MSGPEADGSAEPAPEEVLATEGPGVLGSLPRSRPSVRSPHRTDAAATRSAPKRALDAGEPTDREGREAEVEALARAGVSLAAGAATLGLRAAGRAAVALRDAVERR